MMKRLITVLLLALTGCATVPTDSADLVRTRSAVSFSVVNSPNLTGYLKHWTVGSQSAWFNRSKGDVLVVDAGAKDSIRISGFPEDFGSVTATGWEKGKRFFVHVSRGADTGTMIYCDLKKKEVTEVKHWGAW